MAACPRRAGRCPRSWRRSCIPSIVARRLIDSSSTTPAIFSTDAPYRPGRWWDPYNQNILKGDFPIYGQNVFMNLSAIMDTLFEVRRVPTGSGASSADPDAADNFGNPDQLFLSHNFILSLSIFKGHPST